MRAWPVPRRGAAWDAHTERTVPGFPKKNGLPLWKTGNGPSTPEEKTYTSPPAPGEKSKKGVATLFFVAERGIFKGEMSRNISPLNGALPPLPTGAKEVAAGAAKISFRRGKSYSPRRAKPSLSIGKGGRRRRGEIPSSIQTNQNKRCYQWQWIASRPGTC